MESSHRYRLAGPLAGGLAVLLLTAGGVSGRIDLPVRDALLRLPPALPAQVVAAVVVDEAAVTALGPWPWPRRTLARLVEAIASSGSRAVVLDVLLVDAGPGDGELARALSAIPAVLACRWDAEAGRLLGPSPAVADAATLAHASFEPDHDGVVRRIAATKQGGGRMLAALPLAAARLADPGIAVAIGVALRPDFRVRARDVPVVGASRLLAGGAAGAGLAGRVVFLGATAEGLGDRVMTPTSRGDAPDPGVLVQAAAAEAIAGDRLLAPTPPLASGALAALIVAVAGLVGRLAGRRRVGWTLALIAAPAALGAAALLLAARELPIATLSLVGLLAVAGTELRAGLATERTARRVYAVLAPETRGADGGGIDRLEELAAILAARRSREIEARRVMAHELKTPLTSMRGLTQLLSEYELSVEERRRVAGLAANEAQRLQGMVEGLLEIERLSLRDQSADAVEIDLSVLVEERVQLAAAGDHRNIELDLAPGVKVHGNALLLGRAIDNLLANALKYSPETTSVTVALGAAEGNAVLQVIDHGPGIPAAERERIFDRFARGSTSLGTDGLGLGLALVSEVIAWLNGSITVSETPGGGATFRTSLPLAVRSAREV